MPVPGSYHVIEADLCVDKYASGYRLRSVFGCYNQASTLSYRASKNELDAQHLRAPPHDFAHSILTSLEKSQLKAGRDCGRYLDEDLCTVARDVQYFAFAKRAALHFDPRRNATGSSDLPLKMF
jgi:hypothetical protein